MSQPVNFVILTKMQFSKKHLSISMLFRKISRKTFQQNDKVYITFCNLNHCEGIY